MMIKPPDPQEFSSHTNSAIAWKIPDIKGINHIFCTIRFDGGKSKPVYNTEKGLTPKSIDIALRPHAFWVMQCHQANVPKCLSPLRQKMLQRSKIPILSNWENVPRYGQGGIVPCQPSNQALCFGARKHLHSQSLPQWTHRGTLRCQLTQLEQSSIQIIYCPRSSMDATTLSPDVTIVNVKAKFRNVTRCHKTLSKFAKSLTYGALTLWGRSHLQEGTNTYSWQSIIYQNGLKQKRSPPMMPELFVNFLNLSSPDLVPLVQS
ncbi:hypothetical protein Tco_0184389 [Tanacetum coccineum]